MDPVFGAPDPSEGGDFSFGGRPPGDTPFGKSGERGFANPEGGQGGAQPPDVPAPTGGHGMDAPDEDLADLPDDEGPLYPWLPPEDRLWRHPSEGGAPPTPPSAAMLDDSRHAFTASGWGRTWTVAVIAGLVGALTASAIGISAGWWTHQTTVVRSTVSASPAVSLADAGAGTNWTAVDDSIAASVVSVTVDGPTGPQVGSGLVLVEGSGGRAFVVTDRSLLSPDEEAGYVGKINVTFLSGDVAPGRLIGEDTLSGLAVLEVANAGKDIPAATGTVAELHDAETVMAVGARGSGAGFVSLGSVTGEDRTVPLADGTDMDNLIAVTMSPLSSASGGPLLDQYGRVVGITVGLQPTVPSDQQLTFAVPIDEASRVATQIIDRQQVSHAWLGVSDGEDVPSVMAHQLGLTGGVQVGEVMPGSPASRLGLRANDIVTALDGKPVPSTGSLIALLNTLNPGQTVPLVFIHAGRTVHTDVHLVDEPADAG